MTPLEHLLTPLSPEELAEVEVLTEEEIREALEAGRREADYARWIDRHRVR